MFKTLCLFNIFTASLHLRLEDVLAAVTKDPLNMDIGKAIPATVREGP
jgi:hypothetical protein